VAELPSSSSCSRCAFSAAFSLIGLKRRPREVGTPSLGEYLEQRVKEYAVVLMLGAVAVAWWWFLAWLIWRVI
jgi:hypothetical protein